MSYVNEDDVILSISQNPHKYMWTVRLFSFMSLIILYFFQCFFYCAINKLVKIFVFHIIHSLTF